MIHRNTVEQAYSANVQPKVLADRHGTIAYQESAVGVGCATEATVPRV